MDTIFPCEVFLPPPNFVVFSVKGQDFLLLLLALRRRPSVLRLCMMFLVKDCAPDVPSDATEPEEQWKMRRKKINRWKELSSAQAAAFNLSFLQFPTAKAFFFLTCMICTLLWLPSLCPSLWDKPWKFYPSKDKVAKKKSFKFNLGTLSKKKKPNWEKRAV